MLYTLGLIRIPRSDRGISASTIAAKPWLRLDRRKPRRSSYHRSRGCPRGWRRLQIRERMPASVRHFGTGEVFLQVYIHSSCYMVFLIILVCLIPVVLAQSGNPQSRCSHRQAVLAAKSDLRYFPQFHATIFRHSINRPSHSSD